MRALRGMLRGWRMPGEGVGVIMGRRSEGSYVRATGDLKLTGSSGNRIIAAFDVRPIMDFNEARAAAWRALECV